MNILLELLQEIADGRSSFSPASSAETDMVEFQPIAKVLVFANKQGYLDGFLMHKESSTANGWYDSILVRGGLTYEGEQFLQLPKTELENEANEIIRLKPEIYGIGVDLNALWRKLKSSKKRG